MLPVRHQRATPAAGNRQLCRPSGAVRPPDAAGRDAIASRAAVLRAEGTAAIASAIISRSLPPTTRARRPEIAAFVRELVMRQDPEGYADNNEALAEAVDP